MIVFVPTPRKETKNLDMIDMKHMKYQSNSDIDPVNIGV